MEKIKDRQGPQRAGPLTVCQVDGPLTDFDIKVNPWQCEMEIATTPKGAN